jgi:hypothetical protein
VDHFAKEKAIKRERERVSERQRERAKLSGLFLEVGKIMLVRGVMD